MSSQKFLGRDLPKSPPPLHAPGTKAPLNVVDTGKADVKVAGEAREPVLAVVHHLDQNHRRSG